MSINKYIKEFNLDVKPQECVKITSDVMCNRCNIHGILINSTIYECQKCGDILENILDDSAEWRFYGSDGSSKVDPVRCGTAVNHLLPKSSMATIMLNSTASSNYSMRRTQKMHGWGSMTYKERCLNKVFQDISLRSLNGCILNSITKTAHEYYKKISELHVSRGEIRKGLIAASVYMACKKVGVPRTTTEIAEIFQVSERCVNRGNKKFTEIWQLSGEPHIVYNDDCQSREYLVRFCSKLSTGDSEFLELATEISKIIKDSSLLEQNTPVSVSAASINLSCKILKNNISRSEISKITNTSEVTIAKCAKELNNNIKKFYKLFENEELYNNYVSKL